MASFSLHAAGLAIRAGTDLVWVDNDGTNSGWLGAKGAPFTLTLNISSSAPTTGVDYYLQSTDGFVGGTSYFTMTARTIANATTAYSETYKTNAEVLAAPANVLNPQTDLDLGGVLNNLNNANGPGPYQVAILTFQLPPDTPA